MWNKLGNNQHEPGQMSRYINLLRNFYAAASHEQMTLYGSCFYHIIYIYGKAYDSEVSSAENSV